MLKSKKVLVTGGSGFIGSNLVQYLLDQGGYEVVSLDVNPPQEQTHRSYWRTGNLLEPAKLNELVQEFEPNWVFHLAARTDLQGRGPDDYLVNTQGTENLLDVLKLTPSITAAFFASTKLVCANGHLTKSWSVYEPDSAYGVSKAEAEKAIVGATLGFPWVLGRITSIWGPYFGTPYRDFFNAIQRGRYIHPGESALRKTYGYVGNTVFQMVGLLKHAEETGHENRTYLGDYDPIDVLLWAREIARQLGHRVHVVPLWVLSALASVGDVAAFLGVKRVPLTSFRLKNILTSAVYPLDEVEELLPNLPFDMAQGVENTLRWIRSQ